MGTGRESRWSTRLRVTILTAMVSLGFNNSGHSAWTSEVIPLPGVDVRLPRTVSDANGNAHVAYFNAASNTLEYARQSVNGWEFTVVDHVVGSITYLDLAPGCNATFHIAYVVDGWYPDADYVKYARFSENVWSVHVIESEQYNYAHANIEADGANRVHISYARRPYSFVPPPPYDLRYTCLTGSPVTVETLLTSEDWAGITAVNMKLQGSGAPVLSFADKPDSGPGRALKFARRENHQWSFQTVVTTTSSWAFTTCAMELDSMDAPHLVYDLGSLVHTFWNGSGWTTLPVDASLVEYANVDIQIDTHDRVHAVFDSGSGPSPVFYGKYGGTAWSVSAVILTNGSAGCLALDPADAPSIFYRNSTGGLGRSFQTINGSLNQVAISSIAVSNRTMILGWQAEPRRLYRVQSSPDFLQWRSVGATTSCTQAGPIYVASDISESCTNAPVNQMFFRVFQRPPPEP